MRILFLQTVPIPRPAVMQLAAVLQQVGHQCRVVVAANERDPIRAAVRCRPDVLALSCMTGEHREVLALATRIRGNLPGLVTVMGGPHATAWPQVIDATIDAMIRLEKALREPLRALRI